MQNLFFIAVILSMPIGCRSGESRLGGEFGIIDISSARLLDAAFIADGRWVAQTHSMAMMSGSVMCLAWIAGVKTILWPSDWALKVRFAQCQCFCWLWYQVHSMWCCCETFFVHGGQTSLPASPIVFQYAQVVTKCHLEFHCWMVGSCGLGWSVGVGIQLSSLQSFAQCIRMDKEQDIIVWASVIIEV